MKQILLVITPNTMVFFSMVSKAFQYLGPKVGYSANLCDAEYPHHFFCEPREQADVIYARMEWLEMEGKTDEAKEEVDNEHVRADVSGRSVTDVRRKEGIGGGGVMA